MKAVHVNVTTVLDPRLTKVVLVKLLEDEPKIFREDARDRMHPMQPTRLSPSGPRQFDALC